MTGTGSSPSGVSGIDAQLSEFKRLDTREDGSAVLTLLGKSAERFYFRLPADQLAPLAAAIDLHLGRKSAPPAFPLDAEQIVRLTGAVLARALDAVRHPDAKRCDEDAVTLALGDAAGVALPIEAEPYGLRRLLPRGAESVMLPPDRRPPDSILRERAPDTARAKAQGSASPRQAAEGRGAADA